MLILAMPMDLLRQMFLHRSELGETGEIFLTDPQSRFISPPRFEHSRDHITSRPMTAYQTGTSSEMLDEDYRGYRSSMGFAIFLKSAGAA